MMNASEQGQKAWHHIEQFFVLRENLKKQASENSAPLHTIRIEEVESILYEKLVEQGRPMVYGAKYGDRLTTDLKEAVLHEAIAKMFDAYAHFKGAASLKTYFSRIVEHLVIDHARKIGREQRRLEPGEDALRRASERMAMDAFSEREHVPGSEDALLDQAESILESLDFDRIGLTDKEFLAVVLKLASVCLMKKKLPDAELARKVKMKREAFVDAYLRGRDKICRYLKGDRRP